MRYIPPDHQLPGPLLAALDTEREQLAGEGDYAAQVAAARRRWNNARQRVATPIREALRESVGDAWPCCYCEDSVGSQVEHIRPSSLYPEQTFVWLNLLLACGLCNPIKNDGFAVIVDGTVVPVARRQHDPIVPPLAGPMALLDLRHEDPLSLFELVLSRGVIRPRNTLSAYDRLRANYTLELLHLRDEPHPTRRMLAYGNYRARMHEYVRARDRGSSQRTLDRIERDLSRLPQQMVWREMQRQHRRIPELRELFESIPDALRW